MFGSEESEPDVEPVTLTSSKVKQRHLLKPTIIAPLQRPNAGGPSTQPGGTPSFSRAVGKLSWKPAVGL